MRKQWFLLFGLALATSAGAGEADSTAAPGAASVLARPRVAAPT